MFLNVNTDPLIQSKVKVKTDFMKTKLDDGSRSERHGDALQTSTRVPHTKV